MSNAVQFFHQFRKVRINMYLDGLIPNPHFIFEKFFINVNFQVEDHNIITLQVIYRQCKLTLYQWLYTYLPGIFKRLTDNCLKVPGKIHGDILSSVGNISVQCRLSGNR